MRAAALQVVVLAGLFALVPVGPIAAVASGLAGSMCLAIRAIRPFAVGLPWAPLTVAVVLGVGGAVYAGVRPEEALGVLLVYLQVHRRATRASDADDRASVLLAALMLVAAGGVTKDPLFLVSAIGWAVAMPVALSPADVPARTAAGVSLATAVLAAVVFVVAPRWASPSDDQVDATGFATRVELGALDALMDDPAIVFRAVPDRPFDGTPYWRGLALEEFDGRRWTSGSGRIEPQFQAARTLPTDALVVRVEPTEAGPLFTTGQILEVKSDGRLLADGQGGYVLTGDPAPYRFVALPPIGPSGRPATPPESDRAALQRALALPSGRDARLDLLAERVAGTGPPLRQVERLAEWLRTEFAYTRSPGDAGADAPLEAFLFQTRAGHCEYFASALAVLARARGIPARVVNGYVGGERDPETGAWTVRRYHAHAWVEVHDGGWVPVDATPGPSVSSLPSGPVDLGRWVRRAWQDAVLDYDRGDQLAAVLVAGRGVESLMRSRETPSVPWRGLAVLGGAWLLLAGAVRVIAPRIARRLLDPPRPEPTGPVARAHHRARRAVEHAGYAIPGALPPVDAARWLQRVAPGEAADALHDLAWLYYAVHLGGADASAAAPRARELLERVRRVREGTAGAPP